MIHDCKKVNIKSFQSNIYQHTKDLSKPLLVTSRGKPTFMVSAVTFSAETFGPTQVGEIKQEEVKDEKEHNHSS